GARDVDQAAADLRRTARDGSDCVHVVRAARAGIDPARHAVLQAHRRAFLAATRVRVDVDQAPDHPLAPRVAPLGRVARDIGLDRCDLALGDGNVADRVDTDRGVDDAPTLDDDVISCRKRSWAAGNDRSTGGGRAELAPVHHESLPDVKFEMVFWIAG